MKNWTVRHKIVLSFAIILLVMVAMGSATFLSLHRIETETDSLQTDSLPGAEISNRIMAEWTGTYGMAAGHVVTDDKATMDALEALLRSTRTKLDELVTRYEKTIYQAQDRENFDAFKTALASYLVTVEQVIKLSQSDRKKEAGALITRKLNFEGDKAHRLLQKVVDFNEINTGTSAHSIVSAVKQARWSVMWSLVVALTTAIVCGRLLGQAVIRPLQRLLGAAKVMSKGDFSQALSMERHDEFGALAQGFNEMAAELAILVDQVQKAGIRVNTSVTEIAATAREQQATASEVAATTTEIGATSKEISATSKELVKAMHDVSAGADQTATLAANGHAGLARMEETMQKVMDAAGLINTKLVVLSEKAGNITQVVTTITKVADQTNLLSLNAAIEAEKAGEYGRGFAVVATEIRRLADQTAGATYDIERMVHEIQSAVSAGVMGMERFSEDVRHGMREVQEVGDQLSQIIHQVQALAPRFETVSEGMQAQATGGEQISEALIQLGEASQQTVESLRQSNETIGELNHVVLGLREAVSKFKLHSDPGLEQAVPA